MGARFGIADNEPKGITKYNNIFTMSDQGTNSKYTLGDTLRLKNDFQSTVDYAARGTVRKVESVNKSQLHD
ncbi:hypothetical protein CVT26_009142 [Gymnopilus dilepis]|uniref:Uncharacterized protein n=1 Tax=Gymnopilus dilepis TaxID=231916 RepID=A0A409YRI3_9AGAR|nr:hypothetical protein CVT26_009142 [Gymnopilus dilepis]